MRIDRPREGDEPARSRWYGEHVAREDAIESQRFKARPLRGDAYTRQRFTPERYRARWYERRGVPRDQIPAPFNADKARAVPDRSGPADRTRGLLDIPGGPDVALRSGHSGVMDRLKEHLGGDLPPDRGFARFNVTHVETHAAAYLRLSGRRTATLYVNKRPCRTEPDGCDLTLPYTLPGGARLTVYGPDGYVKTYRGLPDKERRP